MKSALARRVERLERALSPATAGPCLIMASDTGAAEREIARLKTEYGERLPKMLFVMTLADREDHGQ